mgnify:CR=1 FL=1
MSKASTIMCKSFFDESIPPQEFWKRGDITALNDLEITLENNFYTRKPKKFFGEWKATLVSLHKNLLVVRKVKVQVSLSSF